MSIPKKYYYGVGLAILLVALVIVLVMSLNALSLELSAPTHGAMGSPQHRLDTNPSLVAACQYEMWTNTTHPIAKSTSSEITIVNVSSVKRVCYYRDGKISTQDIGDFESGSSAMIYIWYYYDHSGMQMIIQK